MPLTDFQREVLGVIVSNRSEESHYAGGMVLNAPGWIGRDPDLRIHRLSLRGSWPDL